MFLMSHMGAGLGHRPDREEEEAGNAKKVQQLQIHYHQ
ncbi:hypothetical protein ADIAL_1443 [Alkalibacterium sp. AK22]|nr:hypothetical protein ADIAL_1443 [Alkalibacterium sp. AK22]